CVRGLETAVTLYNGRFLQGLIIGDSIAFEEWSLIIHEQTHRRVLTALYQLSRHYARQGKYALAQRYALRQVELEPYREEAHRQLMLTLARSGQRSAALAQYETCRRILNKDLGVAPAAETRSLYQRIRSAGEASPHNLPPPLTPLIGRERELQQIAVRLTDPACRLLTLTGPGGIGKTLLALQAAREHIGVYLHGTYFIPLAPITTPDLLGTTIADAIHCPLNGAGDLQSQLLDFLREKEMLLILDNFEHLLSGSSWLTQILQAAPHVNLLITSRERLNVRGECLLEIRGLSYPAETGEAIDRVEEYSAIQLFMRTARRVQPDYAPSQNEMLHVIRICQHLQGLPLGIELAAAWIRLVTGENILREIERDLDFLATSLRDVPDRHQNMRLVFRQSWRLLSRSEQTSLGKLTVFRSPFSQEGARHVAGANFHMLLSLADKSLLRRTSNGQFDLHELLKQYLVEKLAQHPEEETAAHDAHCHYFARFLEKREQALKGGRQANTLADIALAIEDIRVAWQWAVRHKQFAPLGQAAEGLYLFLWARNRFAEGKKFFAQAINAVSTDDPADETTVLLARLQSRMAEMMLWLGEHEAAETTLQQSIATYRSYQLNHELMLALEILGRLFYAQGAYAPARHCFEESLTISQQIGAKRGKAQALSDLATTICTETADYTTARRMYDESMAVYQQIGDQFGIAKIIINLGAIEYEEANYAAAKRLYEQSLQMYRALDYRYGIGAALTYLGEVARETADYAAAKQLLEESLVLSRDSGHRNAIIESLTSLGRVSTKTGSHQDAGHYLSEALQMAIDIQTPQLILGVLKEYARLLFATGRKEQAVTYLLFLLNYPLEAQELKVQARTLLHQFAPDAVLENDANGRSQLTDLSLEEIVEAVLATAHNCANNANV
ncbi:MAG: tetratricopeptide repeat protein, partial [Aquificales bacterium]|nr:tetratricopeptide repeat protein [Aquificales bacterium]